MGKVISKLLCDTHKYLIVCRKPPIANGEPCTAELNQWYGFGPGGEAAARRIAIKQGFDVLYVHDLGRSTKMTDELSPKVPV